MSLDDIRAREQAATEGPWTYTGRDHQTTWIESPVEDVLIHDERGTGHMRENFSWIKQADAEFIAHARTDIPKLIAALDAVLDLCTDLDDNKHEHVEGCEGEPTCPACWARTIRKTITEALR